MTSLQLHTFQVAAEILIAEHLPVKAAPHWRFKWHYGLATFGTCDAFHRVIAMSKPLAEHGLLREALDTLGHEIAHAYADKAGEDEDHGPVWMSFCKRLKVKPEATAGARGEVIRAKARRARAKNR